MRAQRNRRTEAQLLGLVLLVLLLSATLVLAAKSRTAPRMGDVTLLSRASSAQIARALKLAPDIGTRIVHAQERNGGFADVEALGRLPVAPDPADAARRLERAGLSPRTASAGAIRKALGPSLSASAFARLLVLRDADPDASWERLANRPLLSSARVRAAEPVLIVRTWGEARLRFLLCCVALAVFLYGAHLWIRRTAPGADPFLLPITGLLSCLSVVLLFSLKDPVRDMPSYAAQALAVVLIGVPVLAITVSAWFARLPLHRYGYVYAVAALLGTAILGLFGAGPGGVRLTVAGIQPVELVKVLLVFFLAAYLAERGPLLNDPLRRFGPFPLPRKKDAGPLIVLYTLPLVLFALVKDLGPVLLLFGAFLLLIYLATGRGVYIALGLVLVLVGGAVGYSSGFGVFQTRVDMWLSPWSNRHIGGDQLAHGLWGLSSGGIWGSGLGLGAPAMIPRSGSDLVFASLGEELGLIGTLLVVGCFVAFVLRGFRIAQRAGSDFERLLAAGITGLLAIQAGIILAGSVGAFPLAGITLPFVSYGKSSLIASFFMVGILLMVSARPGLAAVPPPPEFRAGSNRATLVFCAWLVLVIGGRLIWIQAIRADTLAGQPVKVRDADGEIRDHINPRLLSLAARIPRGRILDRTGRVLAATVDGERVYPYGDVTAHLIGYRDPQIGGPTGLEKSMDSTLRGFDTWPSLVPYWRKKDLPGARLPRGKDVTLALDAELQKAAVNALRGATSGLRDRRDPRRRKQRGAVVVLDVATGGILAAVTLPTVPASPTPAQMRELRANLSGDFPLINRAMDGRYPPGSTFKIVTASALLSEQKANLTYICRHVDTNVLWSYGGKTYARRRIVDDEGERAHGLVNLTGAVAESCNVYFAHAGIQLGPEPLRAHAAKYGFDRLPSVQRMGEELPDISYGQGPMLASPLEMATVALTVAGGGRRLETPLVKPRQARVASTPLSPDDAARLAEMMRRVTISGTAAGRFDSLPFSVGGKTGTAQNEENDRVSHSWFIGFAPVNEPRVAFAVIAENAGYGASVAVPVARDVLRALK